MSKIPTNQDLLDILNAMPKEKLLDNLIVYVEGYDEYLPVQAIKFATEDDVLDKGQMFLEIEG
jgi:hypothetical protein